jgi:hypothetical protein
VSTTAWIVLGVAVVSGALLFAVLGSVSSFTGDYRLLAGLLIFGGLIVVLISVQKGKR